MENRPEIHPEKSLIYIDSGGVSGVPKRKQPDFIGLPGIAGLAPDFDSVWAETTRPLAVSKWPALRPYWGDCDWGSVGLVVALGVLGTGFFFFGVVFFGGSVSSTMTFFGGGAGMAA